MRVNKKKEDYYIIKWLKIKWKSYKEISEITWYKIDKIKHHLKAKSIKTI